MEERNESNTPAPSAVEGQLARILRSPAFSRSERLTEFLEFVVRQTLHGNRGELKEITIGRAFHGNDFDPAKTSIVRSTASRVRAELSKYYENIGRDDPILIELPPGHYVPRFTARAVADGSTAEKALADSATLAEGREVAVQPLTQVAARWGQLSKSFLWIAVGLVAFAISAAAWFSLSSRRVAIASIATDTRPRRLLAGSTTEGHRLFRIETGRIHGQLLMAPDGGTLYAISHEGPSVTVVGVKDLQVKRTFDLPFPPGRAFLSANGKHLYMGAPSPHEGVMVLNTATGRVQEVIQTGAPVFDVAVTPDEQKLFLAMGYAGLQRIDLRTRQSRILSPLGWPLGLDIDAVGHRLYVSYQNGGPGGSPGHDVVDIYDTGSERVVGTIKDLPMVGRHPTVSPRGDLVLLDGADACASPAYDHVGCLAVPSHALHLWDALNHRLVASIPPQIPVTASAFFPQESRVFFVGRDLTVWDWRRQMIVEKTSIPGAAFQSAAFTPAGDRAFASISDAPGLVAFDAEDEACLPPIHGLANFYAGDGTLDDSQGVGSLTSLKSPEFAPGRIGQAFRFNGRNGPLRGIAGGDFCTYCGYEWTESLFVKLESLAGEMTILERQEGKLTQTRRLFKSPDNHLVVRGSDGPKSGFSISGIEPAEAGRWYHLAVVAEKHRTSFYIDGALQGQSSIEEPFEASQDRVPIFLGASPGNRSFLNGLVDELAVFNRALSGNEVKSMAGMCGGPREFRSSRGGSPP